MNFRMKDVALKSGVSTATVSHVINGTRYVSDELALKVKKSMEELGYVPNPVARSLRTQSSRTVGLILPILESDTSNFFFMKILYGIQSVLDQHNYNLVLANSRETVTGEEEQLKLFGSQLVDGVIIAPVSEKTVDPSVWLGDRPSVYIDRRPSNIKLDTVTADSRTGVKQAVTRLISSGHRKIGFLSGLLNISTSIDRRLGYEDALTDGGLSIDRDLILEGESTFEKGVELTRKLLKEHLEVTAIMVANNILTMGAVAYLQESGVQIPSEIALIGFDDYDWMKVTYPPITVVKQPAFEMGKKAAEILLAKLEHPRSRSREWKLPTELIIRGSG